jgi:type 1 fimbria pilin
MNMNKNLIAAVLATMAMGSLVSTAHAANQGSGTVTFTGSIINAPCSIAPESADQTVNLGSVSNKALADGHKSSPQNFNIKLQDCDLTGLAKNTITATFTGAPSKANANNLGMSGTASGAAIVLSQGGTDIKLGEPTTAIKVSDGSNILAFTAYLQGESTTTTPTGGGTATTTYSKIVPGDFKSVANFTLAYQ